MTVEDLARLVRDMRKWQRDYFRTKEAKALNASKDYERRVDEAVREVLGDRQPGLFGAKGGET